MSASPLAPFEYTTIRVVPRVERGECLNAGVMLVCRAKRFLAAKVELDRARLTAFAPYLDDEEIEQIAERLALIPRLAAGEIAAGPIAVLSLAERWHWLAAPASTVIQPGPVHTGLGREPGRELERLFAELVRVPAAPLGDEG